MNPVNKILLGVGAAIVAAVAVAFLWLVLSNARLKTQLAQIQANATACHLANDEFAALSARRNKDILAMQKAAADRARHVQAAAIQAQKKIRADYLAAEKMRKATTGGDDCRAAGNLINQFIADEK